MAGLTPRLSVPFPSWNETSWPVSISLHLDPALSSWDRRRCSAQLRKQCFLHDGGIQPGDASVEVLQAEHTGSQLRLPRTHGETIDTGLGYLHTRPLLAEPPRPCSFTHPPCHRGPEQFDDRPGRSPYLCFVANQLPSVRRLWARRDINVPLPDTARQPGLLVYNNNMPAVFRPSCWLWLFPPFPLRRTPFPPRPDRLD